MAVLTPFKASDSGEDLALALVAAEAGGDEFIYSSNLTLIVAADTTPVVVTIPAPVNSVDCGGFGNLPVADKTFTVGAGETFVASINSGYQSPTTRTVAIEYDQVVDVTVGVMA